MLLLLLLLLLLLYSLACSLKTVETIVSLHTFEKHTGEFPLNGDDDMTVEILVFLFETSSLNTRFKAVSCFNSCILGVKLTSSLPLKDG